jgi:hypothetical protein
VAGHPGGLARLRLGKRLAEGTRAAGELDEALAQCTISSMVIPSAVTLAAGASRTFTAVGRSGETFAWSASGGTITPGGLYTAPNAAGTYTITASSSLAPGRNATATVTVPPPAPCDTCSGRVALLGVSGWVKAEASAFGGLSEEVISDLDQKFLTGDSPWNLTATANAVQVASGSATASQASSLDVAGGGTELRLRSQGTMSATFTTSTDPYDGGTARADVLFGANFEISGGPQRWQLSGSVTAGTPLRDAGTTKIRVIRILPSAESVYSWDEVVSGPLNAHGTLEPGRYGISVEGRAQAMSTNLESYPGGTGSYDISFDLGP